MSELGPDPAPAGEVAALLGRSSSQAGPTRATLIDKGLLYSPSHGLAAFTVPRFDEFYETSGAESGTPGSEATASAYVGLQRRPAPR